MHDAKTAETCDVPLHETEYIEVLVRVDLDEIMMYEPAVEDGVDFGDPKCTQIYFKDGSTVLIFLTADKIDRLVGCTSNDKC